MEGNDKQKSAAPDQFCIKCNRFFGNPQTNNMCSKCYREHLTSVLGSTTGVNKSSPAAPPCAPVLEEVKKKSDPERPKQVCFMSHPVG